MKKTTKILLLLLISFTLCGCVQKNQDYYNHVASTILSFYRSSNYDEKTIHKDDQETVARYLSTLTHENQIVDVTKFIDTTLVSAEPNSPEIWLEGNSCYMNYSDLKAKFEAFKIEDPLSVISPYYTATCNGYYAVLKESNFAPPYSDTIKDPTHDYILIKILKVDTGYNYIYSSTYNGTGLLLNLKIENKKIVDITTTDVDPYDYLDEE